MKRNKEKYLFFDTETTGLSKYCDDDVYDTENWPRIVQLSWLLTNAAGRTLSHGNYIVKPQGFEIPRSATKIHHISTKKALEKGEVSYN